eukprot:1157112-Pelagomonas_calceolata.AAC.7
MARFLSLVSTRSSKRNQKDRGPLEGLPPGTTGSKAGMLTLDCTVLVMKTTLPQEQLSHNSETYQRLCRSLPALHDSRKEHPTRSQDCNASRKEALKKV